MQELKERALSRYNLVRVSIRQPPQRHARPLLVPKTLLALRALTLLAPAQDVPFSEGCSV